MVRTAFVMEKVVMRRLMITSEYVANMQLAAKWVWQIFSKWRSCLIACLLMLFCSFAQAGATAHPANSYAFELLPSANLTYDVSVKLYGLPISGKIVMKWHSDGRHYSLNTETRAAIFGKLIEARSDGLIDAYGLAPVKMTEKRFNKPPYSTMFDRQNNKISFTATKEKYPILGGEQDRNSITFQLASIVRKASGNIPKGTEWTFFVAGRRNAQPWTFKVAGMEKVKTAMGEVSALHVKRLQPKNARKQQIELWLASSMDGYPVKILFKDKKQRIEQLLVKIEKLEVSSAKVSELEESQE